MIRHVTYTDKNMTTSALHCAESATKHGCDTSCIYTEKQLSETFRARNASILSEPRGAGYWIWKPQIILQEMEKCKEGDYILYTDAGVQIIGDVRQLVSSVEDGMLLFGGQYNNHEWTKGDVLRLIPEGIYKQLQASAMIFECTTKVVNFLYLWVMMCETPGLIDDSPSISKNHPDFVEHRHDQAILTALQILYQIKSHWWPATYNNGKFNYPKNEHTDSYPVIFHHHRKRNNEW